MGGSLNRLGHVRRMLRDWKRTTDDHRKPLQLGSTLPRQLLSAMEAVPGGRDWLDLKQELAEDNLQKKLANQAISRAAKTRKEQVKARNKHQLIEQSDDADAVLMLREYLREGVNGYAAPLFLTTAVARRQVSQMIEGFLLDMGDVRSINLSEISEAVAERLRAAAGKNLVNDDTMPLAGDIDELERDTPELDTQGGEWIKNKKAARLLGVEVSTLCVYRSDSHGGRTSEDKMFGIDYQGRIWRRVGTPRSHPWYLRSSL